MSNYIDKYTNIVPNTSIQKTPEPTAVIQSQTPQPQLVQELGTNILER